MPRVKPTNTNVSNVDEDLDIDYLQVDKPVPGQNFCCISFVSPENVISDKRMFFFHNYCNYRMAQYQGAFNEGFEKIMETAENGMLKRPYLTEELERLIVKDGAEWLAIYLYSNNEISNLNDLYA